MMPGFAEVTPGLLPKGCRRRPRGFSISWPPAIRPLTGLRHRLSGALDELALRDTFTEVVSGHEALRTRVVTTADGPGQVRSSISRPQWQSRCRMCRPWLIQSRRLAVWRRPAITA
jgi:hypothetical protein